MKVPKVCQFFPFFRWKQAFFKELKSHFYTESLKILFDWWQMEIFSFFYEIWIFKKYTRYDGKFSLKL